MRRNRIAVAVLAAATAAVVAGCGGGGSKTSQSTPTQASGATTQQTANFASAKNCLEFSQIAAKVAGAMTTTTGKNPAAAGQAAAQELQALANAAPSDIRSDFQAFATAFSDYLHALERAGFKPGTTSASTMTPAQIAALVKAAKSLDTAKLAQAEKHISAWAQQNCK